MSSHDHHGHPKKAAGSLAYLYLFSISIIRRGAGWAVCVTNKNGGGGKLILTPNK